MTVPTERGLSLARARAFATIAILVFAVVYLFGLLTRHGLIDGFGHVIGGDLLTLRTAGAIVRGGDGARLYDFDVQAAYERAAVAPQLLRGLNPFTSPPFVALAYRPWAALGHAVAFVLWTVFAVGCLVAALRLAGRAAPHVKASVPDAALLALSFTPVLEALSAGSNALVSLPIFAGTYLALRTRRDGLAGVLLGLQLFRPQLLLAPLVLLAWKRRWRTLAGFAAVAAAFAMLSVLFVATGSLVAWVGLLPLLSRMIFEPGMPTPLFSSVHALFLLPLGPAHVRLGLAAGNAAALLLLAVLLALWSGPWRPEADDFGLRFSAMLVVTPLVSQYLQLHDLSILVVAAVLLVEATWRQPSAARMRAALAVVWVGCMVAPAVTARIVPLPLAPLAVLVLAWAVAREVRRGSGTTAKSSPVRLGRRPAA